MKRLPHIASRLLGTALLIGQAECEALEGRAAEKRLPGEDGPSGGLG